MRLKNSYVVENCGIGRRDSEGMACSGEPSWLSCFWGWARLRQHGAVHVDDLLQVLQLTGDK